LIWFGIGHFPSCSFQGKL
jgi:hypothetical protein